MDQDSRREVSTGAQPPVEPASRQAPVWNQPAQAASGQGQEGSSEYAAWSSDTAYQQQLSEQPQPAQPQAYAAPEPQSATYTDPAPAATSDQQAYAQQQQAYAQQQQAYAQQQQAYQQQYAQPGYDQQAYAQQQAYQQQYGQPGYDQQAYAQQYGQYGYDQQQYAQQQAYQQQYGQQQPGQPYAYAQPGPWSGQEQYWDQSGAGYGRSFLAVLSGFVLMTWGLMFGVGGALVLYLGRLTDITKDMTLSAEVQQLVSDFDEQSTAIGGILLIFGLIQLIGAVGIWAHRKWGRAFGIVLGLLGALWGLAILIAAVGFEALETSLDIAIKGEETSTAGGFLVLVTYLMVLVAMLIGRRHFRKMGVA